MSRPANPIPPIVRNVMRACGAETLEQLPIALGKSFFTVRTWCTRGTVPLHQLQDIARRFGTTIDELLRVDAPEPTANAPAPTPPAGAIPAADLTRWTLEQMRAHERCTRSALDELRAGVRSPLSAPSVLREHRAVINHCTYIVALLLSRAGADAALIAELDATCVHLTAEIDRTLHVIATDFSID